MRRRIVVLGCLLSLLTFENVRAESVKLGEIVVTATRDSQEVRKIPANITVITAEEIEGSNAATIVDVLDKLPGINFTTTSGNEAQAVIDMRGFGGLGSNSFGKVLVMIDGKRLNRPDMASMNWLQIPLSSIEKIEIVRGANSVLYGDNAVAGVINIITKKGGVKPQVGVSTSFGSYGFNNQRFGLSGSQNRLKYSFNLESLAEDGYRDRSAFLSHGANLNLDYKFTDNINVYLNTSFNQQDYQLPGALTKSEMEQDRHQYQPGHSDDDNSEAYQNLSPGIETSFGRYGRFIFNILYGKKSIETNMTSWFSFSDLDINSIGLTPQYILEGELFNKHNKLILGSDYNKETLNVSRFTDRSRVTETAVTEIEKYSLGYYLNDEFNLSENLILNAGIRHEKGTIKANEKDLASGKLNFDDKKEHDGNAVGLGVTYLAGKQSKIFAKFATLYRYPFTDEQASYYGYAGDTFNKKLKAEKGRDYEVGTEMQLSDKLAGGLTFFLIDMEDEISFSNITYQNENIDKTRHQGIEINTSYMAGSVANISLDYTYLNAAFTGGPNKGNKLPSVSDQKALLSVEFLLPYDLSIATDAKYTGKSYLGGDFDNNGDKLPAYTLVDVKLHYRPQHISMFNAFAGIENLFNKKYSTIGFEGFGGGPNNYYPSPERTIKFGLSLNI